MYNEAKDLEFKVVNVESWRAFQPELAEKDGIEYQRKRGSKIVYRQKEDGFECLTCGSEVVAATVAHAIHDGPFPLSGSGKCEYETVPYCPRCEKEPAYHGTPIKKSLAQSIADDIF